MCLYCPILSVCVCVYMLILSCVVCVCEFIFDVELCVVRVFCVLSVSCCIIISQISSFANSTKSNQIIMRRVLISLYIWLLWALCEWILKSAFLGGGGGLCVLLLLMLVLFCFFYCKHTHGIKQRSGPSLYLYMYTRMILPLVDVCSRKYLCSA